MKTLRQHEKHQYLGKTILRLGVDSAKKSAWSYSLECMVFVSKYSICVHGRCAQWDSGCYDP